MKMVWIVCFWILVVIGFSLSIRCPINSHDRVNITLNVADRYIVWYRNNVRLTSASQSTSTGTCRSPSENEKYTIYCEAGGKYTLEVHHPVEGDIYSEHFSSTIITPIIFQEPETIRLVITPPLDTNIFLTDDDTHPLTSTVTCTKPTPVLKWLIRAENGTIITINGESTNTTTGCDVNQITITSRIIISKQTFNLFNQSFQVSSQLSSNECDNIHTSPPSKYFTTDPPPSVTELDTNDRYGTGFGSGVGVCLVLVGVIVLIIWIISKRKGLVIQSRGDGTRGSTGEDNQYDGIENINMSTSSPGAAHSINSQDYINTPPLSVGLDPGTPDSTTAPPQTSTYYTSLDSTTTDSSTVYINTSSPYTGLDPRTTDSSIDATADTDTSSPSVGLALRTPDSTTAPSQSSLDYINTSSPSVGLALIATDSSTAYTNTPTPSSVARITTDTTYDSLDPRTKDSSIVYTTSPYTGLDP